MPHNLRNGVLFACNMNSVRSPMAAVIARQLLAKTIHIDSVGVYTGELDPFIPAILAEQGLAFEDYTPKTFADVDLADFDLIIALTPQAQMAARALDGTAAVVLWDIPNPTDTMGRRDQLIEAYRAARDTLMTKIAAELG